MTTTLTPENFCPACSERLSAATGIKEDTVPKPGDISICVHCGEYLVFDDNLRSQSMSQEEFSSLDDEQKFQISMARFMIMGAVN
jgi:transcription initiation factor IIE alpha subunit